MEVESGWIWSPGSLHVRGEQLTGAEEHTAGFTTGEASPPLGMQEHPSPAAVAAPRLCVQLLVTAQPQIMLPCLAGPAYSFLPMFQGTPSCSHSTES